MDVVQKNHNIPTIICDIIRLSTFINLKNKEIELYQKIELYFFEQPPFNCISLIQGILPLLQVC